MDQLGLGVVGGDLRHGADLGVAHDDGVALDMAEALGIAIQGRNTWLEVSWATEREMTRPLASSPLSSISMSLSAVCSRGSEDAR